MSRLTEQQTVEDRGSKHGGVTQKDRNPIGQLLPDPQPRFLRILPREGEISLFRSQRTS